MLTGHRCCREYLHKYKHIEDPFCLQFSPMECIRFIEERTKIEALLKDELTPGVLVTFMLASDVAWNEKTKNHQRRNGKTSQ